MVDKIFTVHRGDGTEVLGTAKQLAEDYVFAEIVWDSVPRATLNAILRERGRGIGKTFNVDVRTKHTNLYHQSNGSGPGQVRR